MKLNKTISAVTVAASLAIAAGSASAEGQLRGGMTAVNNVASAIATQNSPKAFKWGKKAELNAPVVNTAERPSNSGFRWASKTKASGGQTASIDSKQSGSKWILRNDAGQAGSKWILRSDAEQTGSKWILRSDAEQAGSKWILR